MFFFHEQSGFFRNYRMGALIQTGQVVVRMRHRHTICLSMDRAI